MSESKALGFIEEVILLHLIEPKKVRQDEGKTLADLKPKSVKKSLTNAALQSGLEQLISRGLVEELAPARGSRGKRWRILPHGGAKLEEKLGALSMQKTSWRSNCLRILAVQHFLELPPKVATALVKNSSLSTYFVATRVGTPFMVGTTLNSLAREVAAQALGTSNSQPNTLWNGLLRKAFDSQKLVRQIDHKDSPAKPGEFSRSPTDFSEQVKSTAPFATEGWFGPQKLFIHKGYDVWRKATGRSESLSQFKALLLSALRTGKLNLARADFIVTLSKSDLAESEVKDGAEIFHFIVTEKRESV